MHDDSAGADLAGDGGRAHVAGIVRDARRRLEDAERAAERARAELERLASRHARALDKLRLAQRLVARLGEPLRDDAGRG